MSSVSKPPKPTAPGKPLEPNAPRDFAQKSRATSKNDPLEKNIAPRNFLNPPGTNQPPIPEATVVSARTVATPFSSFLKIQEFELEIERRGLDATGVRVQEIERTEASFERAARHRA